MPLKGDTNFSCTLNLLVVYIRPGRSNGYASLASLVYHRTAAFERTGLPIDDMVSSAG